MFGRVPVNSTHSEYDANAASWQRARDVIAGEDAVKAGGIRYLARLDCQTEEEYAAYRSRASFFNASARTAEGYAGLIFRRAPFLKIPDGPSGLAPTSLGAALAQFSNDADMLGTSLYGYAKNVVGEVIAVGRAGTLMDWEPPAPDGFGAAGGDGRGRAYASLYKAEQIINWRVGRVNGRSVPTMVVLRESTTSKPGPAEGLQFLRARAEEVGCPVLV
jgi:hypothetical protein